MTNRVIFWKGQSAPPPPPTSLPAQEKPGVLCEVGSEVKVWSKCHMRLERLVQVFLATGGILVFSCHSLKDFLWMPWIFKASVSYKRCTCVLSWFRPVVRQRHRETMSWVRVQRHCSGLEAANSVREGGHMTHASMSAPLNRPSLRTLGYL